MMTPLEDIRGRIRRGERLVALSIRQPWAWAILNAGQDVHNAKLETPYRGTILVHTGKQVDFEAYAQAARVYGLPRAPAEDALATGGIIGAVVITDCVLRPYSSRWFFGPFGYTLADAVPLPRIPMRGKRGFFEIEADMLQGAV